MKHEERNFYDIVLTLDQKRVCVRIEQYGYLWTISCDEIECGAESIHDPVEAMKFFFMRVEEYNECGQ
jgi:hypothetical protein